jgi:KaiC/GvpD/RAD55 family RecA-like ATPase
VHFLCELIFSLKRRRLCCGRGKKAFLSALLLTVLGVQLLLSIKTVTSQTTDTYYPSGYNLFGATTYVSGALADLQSDNGVSMVFRSYASQISAQALYVHQETTTIGGASYYLLKLEDAETAGIDLSASMASVGRQLWGRFVYPLTGITSIPASTWTVYYRTWHSSIPENVSENSPSSTPAGTWIGPEGAYSSDDEYARARIDGATQQYGNYGLNIPSTAIVTKVEVGYEAYTDDNEKIGITLSWDNGTNWAEEYVSTPLETTDPNIPTWVDFTNATNWTSDKLSDANFRTRVKCVILGSPSNVYVDWIPVRVTYIVPPLAHADVDILIRRADGTVRQTIATDVANSEALSTKDQTLSGTYSWAAYTVVDETDYLEIDYYLDVTMANPGVTAYLRIDDDSLPIIKQTRTTDILLPSEYTMEVEFTGSADTYYWSQLVWTVDSAWTTGSVSVTLQLYNYTLGAYSASGDGYIAYTSSATSNTEENQSQTITAKSTDFRDDLGNWKMKIKGVKSTTSQFDFKADLIKYEVTSAPPHDITVLNVTHSPTSVYPGEIVRINVTVKNEGGTTENFNVTVYYNNTPIEEQTVSGLAPSANITLTFNWNTTGVSPSTYTIKAIADIVLGETDTADNTYLDGYVEVKAIRDIAVISVTASPTTVTTGQNVNISVVVKNEGLVSETFNVTSYCNNTVIGTQTLANLDAGANRTLLFVWNTTGVSMDNYVIKAVASNVTGETDTDDNTFIDGAVKVLMVYVHDVAVVSVTLSRTEVYAGQTVNISVVVRNEGNAIETFNVTLCYDDTTIGTQTVINLEPGAERTLKFTWDTTDATLDVGYAIRAEASAVPGETDTTDNIHIGGTVEVKSKATRPFDWNPVIPYLLPISFGLISFLVIGVIWKKRGTGSKYTGFEFFDEVSGGGIPDASSVMIMGGPSSGKSMLCQQLAYNYLTQGKSCIYVTYDGFPDEIRNNMKNFHWETSMYERKGTFQFIDCYSSIAGVSSQEKHHVKQPFELSGLGIIMSTALDEVKEKSIRVFLDSTTPLFTRLNPSNVIKFLQDRSARIKGDNGIFFFTIGKGTIPSNLSAMLEGIVDCIIELDVHKEEGETLRKLRITKLRGRRFVDTWVSFKIDPKRGLLFKVPRDWSKIRL